MLSIDSQVKNWDQYFMKVSPQSKDFLLPTFDEKMSKSKLFQANNQNETNFHLDQSRLQKIAKIAQFIEM